MVPDLIDKLDIPAPLGDAWKYPTILTVPDRAAKLIRGEHAKRQQGAGDALDGHALYCQEKLAYALAALDNRTEMKLEDWRRASPARCRHSPGNGWRASSKPRVPSWRCRRANCKA